MRYLEFYISEINSNLLKTIGGRQGELIALIQSGKYQDEKALAIELYPGNCSAEKYRKLKYRTRRVLEAFYLINPSIKGNETLQQVQKCRKLYHLGMHLAECFKGEEAKRMFEQAYKIAEEYDLTLLAYNCTVELITVVSLDGKKKKLEQYTARKNTLWQDLNAEHLVREYYDRIVLYMNKKQGVAKGMFPEFIAKLDALSCTTTKFLEYYYMIRVLQNLNKINYPALKDNTEKALSLLDNRKGVPDSVLQFFHKQKAIAHIALKEYDEAARLLSFAEQYAPEHSLNRHILYYYQAVNALHAGRYQDAYTLFREHRHTKHKSIAILWTVMEAYLYFLRITGNLDVGTDRFSVGKYLNDTISVTHDKTGNKINLIIAELLVYFIQDRDKFIDRTAIAIKYPHMKGKETWRAKRFIKILCTVPRANFDWVALRRLARRSIEWLKDNPMHLESNIAIEIIPFEPLLDIMKVELSKSQGEWSNKGTGEGVLALL